MCVFSLRRIWSYHSSVYNSPMIPHCSEGQVQTSSEDGGHGPAGSGPTRLPSLIVGCSPSSSLHPTSSPSPPTSGPPRVCQALASQLCLFIPILLKVCASIPIFRAGLSDHHSPQQVPPGDRLVMPCLSSRPCRNAWRVSLCGLTYLLARPYAGLGTGLAITGC